MVYSQLSFKERAAKVQQLEGEIAITKAELANLPMPRRCDEELRYWQDCFDAALKVQAFPEVLRDLKKSINVLWASSDHYFYALEFLLDACDKLEQECKDNQVFDWIPERIKTSVDHYAEADARARAIIAQGEDLALKISALQNQIEALERSGKAV